MCKNIVKLLESVGRHKDRYKIFDDFVTMFAISLHNNGAWFDDKREQEYLKIIRSYDKQDQDIFCKAIAVLIIELDVEPKDVLGSVFMEMELGDSRNGQYFTPDSVSRLMATVQVSGIECIIKKKGYFSLSECAAGSGGMILAVVNELLNKNINPSKSLWVEAVDISRIAALMCYIQLTLWGIPAKIIVGNSLTMKCREVWYTPIFIQDRWDKKIAS